VDCRDVIDRLSEYLDQEVLLAVREELEAHFAACEGCRIYIETLKKTITLYRSEADSQCPEQVRARLHAILSIEYRKK